MPAGDKTWLGQGGDYVPLIWQAEQVASSLVRQTNYPSFRSQYWQRTRSAGGKL